MNKDGQVIGVTCASYASGQNLNLAIPSNDVLSLAEKTYHQSELSDLYENTLTGYAAYSESEVVDYSELCSNPEKYEERLISVAGYVVDTKQGENIFEFALAPNADYQVTVSENRSEEFLSGEGTDSKIIICQTGLHTHTTFENGANPSTGDYVIVCGFPIYLSLAGNVYILDVRLVSIAE